MSRYSAVSPSTAAPWRSNHNFQTMRWQESLARLLAPLTIWICVSVTIRYGYFADHRLVVGPNSSCLLDANSLFVSQVQVKDGGKTGVSVYGFFQKPELTFESNWNVSKYLIVASYARKGISLWLNKDSTIQIRWEVDQSTILDHLHVSLTKGDRNQEIMNPTMSSSTSKETEAEYHIEEDDKYYVGIINANPRSIIIGLNMNVTSKMYDTSKGNNSVCSTLNGSCSIDLLFPSNQFILVTTPNNGDIVEWYIDLSFIPRILSYAVILGFMALMVLLIAKYIGAYQEEEETIHTNGNNINASETDPLIPDHQKSYRLPYGTRGNKELEEESGSSTCSSSSSEDLYDGKICVICYDMARDCFFVPCGHCATCYECAKRITESDTRVCPICRRMIHKVRKLIIP
ncbi:E3 ubiquitin-protein ligase APD2-like [Impatiens glandulifera]|uniref:E3 ubiquitin-protein ligase APD2-like n=1 Tax=Impatiens glandulifera TaxID=253017 RepID=UPI001FB0B2E5|nr:E3 ubiquitin-protein ligase APD2-like [Impatiens glandulifera]